MAAGVAESRAVAEDAAALVEVEYEALPGVSSAEAAAEADASSAWDNLDGNVSYTSRKAGGDADRAFAEADCAVSLRIENPRVAAVAIEPRAILVAPEPMGDGLTVWASAQSPFR